MNPTMAPQVTSSADVPRNVLCRHYSHCLDLAIQRGWQGFSCEQCERYDLEPAGDLEHWQEQAGRCRLLLARLFAPQPKVRRRRPANPDRNQGGVRISEIHARRPWTYDRLEETIDGETIQLPEGFLAHLMLLWENRPHE